ncbi:MAG: ribonuclease Z [Geminicoccaceae bacterium]
MIEAVLLGTGGMMPLPDRWLSALLIRVRGDLTLFDCGEGTQIAWREAGWGFRRLGAICISHTHADHIAGLPGLLHAGANADRVEPVDLFGPPGITAVVRGLRVIAPLLPYEVKIHELRGGETFTLPGGLRAACQAGEHQLPVLAYRVHLPRAPAFLPDEARRLGVPTTLWHRLQQGDSVAWASGSATPDEVLGPPRPGLSVAYVTDTRPLPELTELSRGVDLLVCEGTYGSDEDAVKARTNTHMTFREAATLARDAGARRLWITHFSPGLADPMAFASNVTDVFPDAVVGSDGLMINITFGDDDSS